MYTRFSGKSRLPNATLASEVHVAEANDLFTESGGQREPGENFGRTAAL